MILESSIQYCDQTACGATNDPQSFLPWTLLLLVSPRYLLQRTWHRLLTLRCAPLQLLDDPTGRLLHLLPEIIIEELEHESFATMM
jgi:hypothetical protein